MTYYPNTSRRMFRGRGGPTDGRINKYQARKRHHPKPREKSIECSDDKTKENCTSEAEEIDGNVIILDISDEKCATTDENDNHLDNDAPSHCQEASKKSIEINHLLKRVENVSSSISLSGAAISNPSTWKNNVLNAVKNTVGEWDAILRHHDVDDTEAKEPSLAIFMLIQQAMQSGPLTGSNPGYFKRCGAIVAKQALFFLQETIPVDSISLLRFSEKQVTAIKKWKSSAATAVEKDKPATKSQLKKQQYKGNNKSKLKRK